MPKTLPVTQERFGPELVRATKPYSDEDPARTWRLFGVTGVISIGLIALAVWPALGPGRYVAAFAMGLVNVRLFIFYHDAMHGAIFRKSPIGKMIMKVYGWLILTPDRVWKDSHNYHHAHTSKIVGASIGSYPILTVRMYNAASKWQRMQYRLARHWLNMLLGYFTVFLLGMCVRPLMKNPRRNYSAAIALIVHYGLATTLTYLFGFEIAFLTFLFPFMVSCAVGSYLFYAQHNFPDMELRERRNWEYTAAALHSSSMMRGGRLMMWLTGNIGYHHVHHLNSQIPFYRLAETMSQVPELQSPAVTSLSLKDALECLRLHVWDPHAGRMLTYQEARAGRS